MTDDRLGGLRADDPLWSALARLPFGAGVIFRHYGLPSAARKALLAKVAAFARRHRLLLLGSRIGGAPDGVHLPAHQARVARSSCQGLTTASVHSRRELVQAFAAGADLVFLSPVFATSSHPGAQILGPVRFGLAARPAAGPVVALGGMDKIRARRLRGLGAAGYAGIDCWAVSPESRARVAGRSGATRQGRRA